MSGLFIVDFNITSPQASQWFSPQGDSIALGPVAASPPHTLRSMPLETNVMLTGLNATCTAQWQTANGNASWTNIGSAFSLSAGAAKVASYFKLTLLTQQMIRLNVTAVSNGRVDITIRTKQT